MIATGAAQTSSEDERFITIGVLDSMELPSDPKLIDELIAGIQKNLPSFSVKKIYVSEDEAQKEILDQKPDFLIAPATIELFASEVPYCRIATRKGESSVCPSYSRGAVIATLGNRTDVGNIADLREKVIGFGVPKNSISWLSSLRELEKHGLKEEIFSGPGKVIYSEPDDVLNLLYNNLVDVVVLPTCLLEEKARRHELTMTSFRVLNEKTDERLSCVRSTELYPDISIVSFDWTSSEPIRDISIGILNDEKKEIDNKWIAYVPYDNMQSLYKDLKVGPFAYLAEFNPSALVRRYPMQTAVLIGVLLAVIVYGIVLHLLLRKRSKQLVKALEEQKEMDRLAREQRTRLSALERRNVIHQMSGMIAHEIKSPVATICNFKTILDKHLPEEVKANRIISLALQGIETDAERIAGIVDRVRSHAKSKKLAHQPCDLIDIAGKAIRALRASVGDRVVHTRYEAEHAWVMGDSLELELLMLNLMLNAAQAKPAGRDDSIELFIRTGENERHWEIEIKDKGVPLEDKDVVRFNGMLQSVKPGGLGMGLSIVRGVADSHAAQLEYRRNVPYGLSVFCRIHKIDKLDQHCERNESDC